MHLVFNGLFLLAAIRWGDWKNWNQYHSTILFLWYGDLPYNLICYDYKMWEYKESIFAKSLLSNHTIITLLIMFVAYPATVIIYLGKFPKKFNKIVLWIGFWVALFSIIEFINLRYLDLISHQNGWSLQWSIVFNLILFPMLYFHYKNPKLALLISFPIVFILIVIFNVPIK